MKEYDSNKEKMCELTSILQKTIEELQLQLFFGWFSVWAFHSSMESVVGGSR